MNSITIENIRRLRRTLRQTQHLFAKTVGASKDSVASWEIGRNGLSNWMAGRMALATGVEARSLFSKSGRLRTFAQPQRDFTKQEYLRHQKEFWGEPTEAKVRRHLQRCSDALGLVFRAAAQGSQRGDTCRLADVMVSFMQWCDRTRKEYQLGPAIDRELKGRTMKLVLNQSYAEWREMEKTNPEFARKMGFKDVPNRDGKELLELSLETVPAWTPGHDMRGEKHG